jgi:hypothetical protein
MEEIFTDRRIGTIRRLTPVNEEGQRDTARAVLYMGETQGPHARRRAADRLRDRRRLARRAAEKFGQLAKEAIERTVKELQELRRPGRVVDRRPPGRYPARAWAGWAAAQDPDALSRA